MKIYTVTEFNREMKEVLSQFTVVVQGEISNFQINQGRFVFFELKDDQSRVKCFLMKFNLQQKLEDGLEIRVIGTPSLFTKSGGFNISVKSIELIGEGALQKEFERLKKKLAAEGLFDTERKRALPRFPEKIAIITSEDAAAFTDVKRMLDNRWPSLELFIYSTRVQGVEAIGQIVQAIKHCNRDGKVEVIILTRGGGSIEDLQAFNSEDVARAVFASHIPVVAGVGHERDVTLVDFVADQRAATPTHAAELVVPHHRDVLLQINEVVRQQSRSLANSVNENNYIINDHLARLNHFLQDKVQQIQKVGHDFALAGEQWLQVLSLRFQQISSFSKNIDDAIRVLLQREERRLTHHRQLLGSLNPLNILKRGYSVTYTARDNRMLKDGKNLKKGDIIKTKLAEGEIQSNIT